MTRSNNEPNPSDVIPDWKGPLLRSWRCSICGERHAEDHPHFDDRNDDMKDEEE